MSNIICEFETSEGTTIQVYEYREDEYMVATRMPDGVESFRPFENRAEAEEYAEMRFNQLN